MNEPRSTIRLPRERAERTLRKRSRAIGSPVALHRVTLRQRILQHKYFYILLAPAFLFYLIFNYVPMYGIVMSFKHFRFNTPSAIGDIPLLRYIGQIMNMEWVGLKWFGMLWGRPDFWRAFNNTLIISSLKILFGFPAPIILALLLNEVKHTHLKRFYQTVYTFPHFLSWVLVSGLVIGVLSTNGLLNQLIVTFGGEKTTYLIDPKLFRGLLVGTEIWKGVGWGTIIYLAAMAGIDPQLYEAAAIDGANRWSCVVHITWPGIKSTAVILLILSCGNVLNAGFDQILNLYNAAVYEVADIIDTYVYRMSFVEPRNLSFTVAVGFFKSVINFLLLLAADRGAKLLGYGGLF